MNPLYHCTHCGRGNFSPGGLRAHACHGKRLPTAVTNAMIAAQDAAKKIPLKPALKRKK